MISIRNAKNAKIGLQNMIDYIGQFIDVKESKIIEIGCYVGDATEIFAQNFKRVYCVDPWRNGYDDSDAASYKYPMEKIERQFDKNIMAIYNNVFKIRGRSLEVVKDFPDKYFDVVYIDGIHQYEFVKMDIAFWLSKIREGGFMTGHDYQSRFQGTIDAVDEFKKPDKVFEDTSWCIKI